MHPLDAEAEVDISRGDRVRVGLHAVGVNRVLLDDREVPSSHEHDVVLQRQVERSGDLIGLRAEEHDTAASRGCCVNTVLDRRGVVR